jgi:DNA repair exonuclease SbcCD nuclease subunit
MNCRLGAVRDLKPFSFVHAADLHLGYSQYGLEVRREDFDRAFQELVDKALELKPDFMIIARDLFHQARSSNSPRAVTHSDAFAEKAEHVIRLEKEMGQSKISVEK